MNNAIIKITQKAMEDIESIHEYITEQLCSYPVANDLIFKIESAIMNLKEFPYSGSPVLDEILKRKNYRKLIVKNYIIFYIVMGKPSSLKQKVIIMRVLFGGTNYIKILKESADDEQ